MRLSNHDQFPMDPVLGESPHILFGPDAPTGTISPWLEAPVGSEYTYVDAVSYIHLTLPTKRIV